MIRLLKKGHYGLVETAHDTKILHLDGTHKYAWIHAENIGEILVGLHHAYAIDHTLVLGNYRLYEVKDEPKLTDTLHLELFVGNGSWQGYLLPTGLPSEIKKRNRIIPTYEIITKSPH